MNTQPCIGYIDERHGYQSPRKKIKKYNKYHRNKHQSHCHPTKSSFIFQNVQDIQSTGVMRQTMSSNQLAVEMRPKSQQILFLVNEHTQ